MEFETTANGFILKVDDTRGPTIEWDANEDEMTVLLPTLDGHGGLDPKGRRFMVHVRRHPSLSPSVSVYPL